MPIVIPPSISDSTWLKGPMGPGFFILFPKNIPLFYDGAPLPKEDIKDTKTRKRDIELLALLMLMREQC
jgi:hypothetical protein